MLSYEEVGEMLDEIALEIPEEFFKYLNGGIILENDFKYHPEAKNYDLYILGEYKTSSLGRSIVLYYGSFVRVYGSLENDALREQYKSTLLHEFTHHLESLSGENGLIIKDIIQIEEYKQHNL